MTLLTLTELREHIETDLVDDALQRLLDAEDEEILRRCGAPLSQTQSFAVTTQTQLFLTRPASVLLTVTETDTAGVTTTLAATDYELWWGQAVERVTGTWGPRVTVVYTPRDTTAQRIGVLIQLVQLALRYSGVQSESIGGGDYSATYLDYQRERERLLGRLAPRGGVFLA